MGLIGAGLAQAVDKLLDLTRRDFVHIEVPKGCIDPLRHIGIAGLCALAQGLFHILLHPLLGEGFKFVWPSVSEEPRHSSQREPSAGSAPSQSAAPSAWRRRPGLRLHHLLALRGIAHRGPDTV